MYKSGNPFKRPCPLVSIVQTRGELQELHDRYEKHGESKLEKPKPAAGKSKATAAELRAYTKNIKGIEDERALAVKIAELIPAVEKEEQVRLALDFGLIVANSTCAKEDRSGCSIGPIGRSPNDTDETVDKED